MIWRELKEQGLASNKVTGLVEMQQGDKEKQLNTVITAPLEALRNIAKQPHAETIRYPNTINPSLALYNFNHKYYNALVLRYIRQMINSHVLNI